MRVRLSLTRKLSSESRLMLMLKCIARTCVKSKNSFGSILATVPFFVLYYNDDDELSGSNFASKQILRIEHIYRLCQYRKDDLKTCKHNIPNQ